ncbi:putative membrane protein [Brucella grignonensis]|uniref:Putative membrane protein n=1 Tax=Brucella grignonensis TaxID=94627 RepID=A0A256F0W0_9HYPH|nr:putative membrane protein [Brucella grignonensis]
MRMHFAPFFLDLRIYILLLFLEVAIFAAWGRLGLITNV